MHEGIPTMPLVELQCTQSRMRSAKRHNRHVLRAARRDRVQTAICKAAIGGGGILLVLGSLWFLRAVQGA